jgi:PPOX class probable FMN-dependent enzyme
MPEVDSVGAVSTDPTHDIPDAEVLRSRYRPAHPAILAKARPKIDPKAADFIAASPFLVLATTSPEGTDASPRGGPPGFVRVLDDGHLALGDLAGNNRLDSYGNIVEHPQVGLIFFVPGIEETLRVNGRASLTTDPTVLDQAAVDGRTPKVAVVVAVDECFIHCAKALRRSGLWDPGSWGAVASPTGAEVIVDAYQLDVDPALVAADLEVGYQETIWEAGGL